MRANKIGPNAAEISRRIVALRKKMKLTPSQLARRVRVRTEYLYRWESAEIYPEYASSRRISRVAHRAGFFNDAVYFANIHADDSSEHNHLSQRMMTKHINEAMADVEDAKNFLGIKRYSCAKVFLKAAKKHLKLVTPKGAQ
jgi:transcriptional regulator with XRE-family HTH domain